MGPKSVCIIRHAEKPASASDPHLSSRGRKRALALAKRSPQLFGRLDCLIAASSSSRSARPVETITPLSEVLNQEIESEYGNQEYLTLMGKLLDSSGKYEGQSVLLCWHHEIIPRIAHVLGAPSAPRKWLDHVFDRI